MDSLKGAKLLKADGSSVDAEIALQGKVSNEDHYSLPLIMNIKYLILGSDPVLLLCPLVPPVPGLHSQAQDIL